MIPPSPTFPQQLGELGALADEQADDAHARGGQTAASRLHESKQRLDREITSHLTSLEVLGGDIQLVRFKDHFGLDIQAVHTRVDGKRAWDHAFLMLAPAEMRDLRRVLSAAIAAAEVATVDRPARRCQSPCRA